MKLWNPPLDLAPAEERVLKLCKKQKLWSFLRRYRHLLLDEEIRNELAVLYSDCPGGRPPEPPERLALAMLLQVAFDAADHEVPTLTAVDRRWQVVLDCFGEEGPAFSQGTVFNFRERARNSGFMKRLLDKTIELARETKGFSHKRLRVIFDSSPLVGAGRVEDTFNLLGRAIVQLVHIAAAEQGRTPDEVAKEIDLPIVAASSIKAALDVDWREPQARSEALNELIAQFRRVEQWMASVFDRKDLQSPPLVDPLTTVHRILDQDTEPDPGPGAGTATPAASKRKIRQGGSKEGGSTDRMVSLSDRDMRFGRKSKSKVFPGYKRHIAVDRDIPGLICEVDVQPANRREHDAAKPLLEGLEAQGFEITEVQIDRGYLSAPEIIRLHDADVDVVSKPPTPRSSERISKTNFTIDFVNKSITCPANEVVPLPSEPKAVYFPTATCRECSLRDSCISPSRKYGRILNLHPQEQWYREMTAELATTDGRKQRRQRTIVEHALARVGMIQGTRARFRGIDKNQFDLERTAVLANCYVLGNLLDQAA